MFACVEMAADKAAKQACKQSEAKAALADSLGEDAADVTESEVEQYVRKAAKNKIGNEMETCMTLAGEVDNEIKACKDTKAKAALAKSLGKDESDVTAAETGIFCKKASKGQMGDKMTACYTAAANNATLKAACKTSGKTALGRALGKKSADVTAADVDEAIDKAAKQKVAGIVDACSKAAAGDATKLAACSKDTVARRSTVKSPAKRAIEEATGKTTVSDVDVFEFKNQGGRDEP